MKKLIIWTSIATLLVAILAHIITLIVIPYQIMNNTMAKFPTNVLLKGTRTTAESRGVVMPCPDLVYSIATYDVSKYPLYFSAKVPDAYWSVSFYDTNSDNYFVINDKQVKSNPVELLLVGDNWTSADAGKAQVVKARSNKGIMLVRYLLIDDTALNDLYAVQKQSSLKAEGKSAEEEKSAEIKLSFDAAEYVNAENGFSIKYPKDWKPGSATGRQVFVASAPSRVPTMSISVVTGDPSMRDALSYGLNALGFRDISIGTESQVSLSDGTLASKSKLTFTLPQGYAADALALGAHKDGKLFLVVITTVSLAAPYDDAMFSEIARSLQFSATRPAKAAPVEYKNAEYGFSITYPGEWKEGSPTGNQVFVAAAAEKVPTISVSVIKDDPPLKAALSEGLPALGYTGVTVGPESQVSLADGTPASQCKVGFNLPQGYWADSLALGVHKDGKLFLVMVTTVSLGSPYDEAKFSEIAKTLKFTN